MLLTLSIIPLVSAQTALTFASKPPYSQSTPLGTTVNLVWEFNINPAYPQEYHRITWTVSEYTNGDSYISDSGTGRTASTAGFPWGCQGKGRKYTIRGELSYNGIHFSITDSVYVYCSTCSPCPGPDPQPPSPDCDPPCDWPEYCWGGNCTIPDYDLIFIIGIICVAFIIIGKKKIKKYKKQ